MSSSPKTDAESSERRTDQKPENGRTPAPGEAGASGPVSKPRIGDSRPAPSSPAGQQRPRPQSPGAAGANRGGPRSSGLEASDGPSSPMSR